MGRKLYREKNKKKDKKQRTYIQKKNINKTEIQIKKKLIIILKKTTIEIEGFEEKKCTDKKRVTQKNIHIER